MIRTRESGDVTVMTLDRPERRNALTPAGLDDLAAAVEGASAPVVLVEGAGSAFCAGADLEYVRGLRGRPDAAAAFARRGQATMNAIEDADAVVVAGVDGPARGGGVELALACDVAVATPAASFAETGVRIGLFGAWGGTRRLPEAVGAAVARDLSLSGRSVDATDAAAIGLVTRVVDDPLAVAHEIAANDTAALRELGGLLADTDSRTASDDAEAAAFARLLAAQGWVVFEAGHAELIAGLPFLGQVEERLRELVDRLRGRPVLWYVPSFQSLALAGRHRYGPLGALDFILRSLTGASFHTPLSDESEQTQ